MFTASFDPPPCRHGEKERGPIQFRFVFKEENMADIGGSIYVYQQFVQFVDRVPIVSFDMGSLLLFPLFLDFLEDIGKKQKQRSIDLLHTDKSDEHLAKSCRHTFGGDRFSRRLSIPPMYCRRTRLRLYHPSFFSI